MNRGFGTLKRKLSSDKNQKVMDMFIDLLSDSKDEYQTRLAVTRLHVDGDGTKQITVDDGSIFAINDTIFVVSETQPEVSGTVRFINGNVLVLSFVIPSTYLRKELARIYKEL